MLVEKYDLICEFEYSMIASICEKVWNIQGLLKESEF